MSGNRVFPTRAEKALAAAWWWPRPLPGAETREGKEATRSQEVMALLKLGISPLRF